MKYWKVNKCFLIGDQLKNDIIIKIVNYKILYRLRKIMCMLYVFRDYKERGKKGNS